MEAICGLFYGNAYHTFGLSVVFGVCTWLSWWGSLAYNSFFLCFFRTKYCWVQMKSIKCLPEVWIIISNSPWVDFASFLLCWSCKIIYLYLHFIVSLANLNDCEGLRMIIICAFFKFHPLIWNSMVEILPYQWLSIVIILTTVTYHIYSYLGSRYDKISTIES